MTYVPPTLPSHGYFFNWRREASFVERIRFVGATQASTLIPIKALCYRERVSLSVCGQQTCERTYVHVHRTAYNVRKDTTQ